MTTPETPMDCPKPEYIPFYRLEVDDEGCPNCLSHKSWTIVGRDEIALGMTFEDRDEAAELADLLNDAYDKARPAQPAGGVGVDAVIDALKVDGDRAYCNALNIAAENCKGAQWKLENGKFGDDDLKWHCQHHEKIGFHRGIYHAVNMLREATPSPAPVPAGVVEALERIRDGMPKDDEDYYDGWAYEYRILAEQALQALNRGV